MGDMADNTDQRSEQELLWAEVDHYFAPLAGEDEILAAANDLARHSGLPAIQVSASQGKLLQLITRLAGARRVLEIGTLAGYSTIWLGRALPADGLLLTCEFDPAHAEVAARNIEAAGLDGLVDLRQGRAADTLRGLASEGTEPFDLVFIDADKPSNPEYLQLALQLTHPGSVIILDNAVRRGAVADPASTDADVLGVRAFTELVLATPQLSATAIQTVGVKGYDGFILLRVVS